MLHLPSISRFRPLCCLQLPPTLVKLRHEQQEAALLALEVSEDLDGMDGLEGLEGEDAEDDSDPVKQAARAAAKAAATEAGGGEKGSKGGADEKALAAQMKSMLKGGAGAKAEFKA